MQCNRKRPGGVYWTMVSEILWYQSRGDLPTSGPIPKYDGAPPSGRMQANPCVKSAAPPGRFLAAAEHRADGISQARSDLNPVRRSATIAAGCSHAAKWAPFSCLL